MPTERYSKGDAVPQHLWRERKPAQPTFGTDVIVEDHGDRSTIRPVQPMAKGEYVIKANEVFDFVRPTDVLNKPAEG